MSKSPKPHLVHIRRSLDAIETYRPASRDELVPQSMAWDAILMRLHAIGEHLAQIRSLDQEQFSAGADPSWHKAIGLRNVISHGYESIDRDTLWLILTEDLPLFAQTIDEYMQRLP